MADVGQGEIGYHHRISGIIAPHITDNDPEVIIGGGRPPVMIMKEKMILGQKVTIAVMTQSRQTPN